MKKSNIFLLSIVAIFFIMNIVIQLHLKDAISKIEDTSIVLNYDNFNKLNVGTGWYLNIVNGEKTTITINEDSLKNLFSINENILTFDDAERNNGRIRVDITNPAITHLNVSGSSYIKYNINFIDTIYITQTGESSVRIQSIQNDDENNLEAEEEIGVINYASLDLSGKSDIKVYNNVNNLTGMLKDSSRLMFTEQVFFTNFNSSKKSRIQSW